MKKQASGISLLANAQHLNAGYPSAARVVAAEKFAIEGYSIFEVVMAWNGFEAFGLGISLSSALVAARVALALELAPIEYRTLMRLLLQAHLKGIEDVPVTWANRRSK